MPRPQQMHLVPLSYMVDEAIEFIRANEPPEGYFVAFSGGKDSIVTLELTRMAGVRHQAYYSATGIDPPEVVRFIRKYYPEIKHLRPKMTFWEGIYKKRPPFRMSRWCCDLLKKTPSNQVPFNKHRIVGIRAEESFKRASRPRISNFSKQWHYKPIFTWTEWHVWDFIEENNLPYPSLYDEGFHRIGCIICPFIKGKNLAMHQKRWPGVYKAFEHAVTRWFDDKWNSKDKDYHTAEQYLKAWYLH